MSDIGGITAPAVDKLVPYGAWMKTHIPRRLWPAGTEVSYSNYRAALAGYIVERVSGEPLADSVERSEEHTSELPSLIRASSAVFRLKKRTPRSASNRRA